MVTSSVSKVTRDLSVPGSQFLIFVMLNLDLEEEREDRDKRNVNMKLTRYVRDIQVECAALLTALLSLALPDAKRTEPYKKERANKQFRCN